METLPPKVPQLAPEQILRACDYMELVWQEQGSKARLTVNRARARAVVTRSQFGLSPLSFFSVAAPRRGPQQR
ncbi:hypothetical protein AB0E62_39645 [Streptomyces sp. NPDC038707]|uniref:hypothetical protein n=1 Tax=Streptomyces sp. NPDC038707 TaxID=3154329 RepID=UPI0033CB448E